MNRKERFIFYSSPEHWLQASLELNSSVELLFERKGEMKFHQQTGLNGDVAITKAASSRAIYLLMAYSLENLLKGIAVLRDPSLVNSGTLKKVIKTHKLNELSSMLGFTLNEDQISFQDILSTHSVSNARYPVGTNENIEIENLKIVKNDFSIYQTLYKKYRKSLVEEFHQKGWDSGLENTELNTKPKEFNFVDLDNS